jgi:hypothetical protein
MCASISKEVNMTEDNGSISQQIADSPANHTDLDTAVAQLDKAIKCFFSSCLEGGDED